MGESFLKKIDDDKIKEEKERIHLEEQEMMYKKLLQDNALKEMERESIIKVHEETINKLLNLKRKTEEIASIRKDLTENNLKKMAKTPFDPKIFANIDSLEQPVSKKRINSKRKSKSKSKSKKKYDSDEEKSYSYEDEENYQNKYDEEDYENNQDKNHINDEEMESEDKKFIDNKEENKNEEESNQVKKEIKFKKVKKLRKDGNNEDDLDLSLLED